MLKLYIQSSFQSIVCIKKADDKCCLKSGNENVKAPSEILAEGIQQLFFSAKIELGISGELSTGQLNYIKLKKSKRKVQGVPQSQTAALPRPQEEEETDKSKQAQIEQT